MFIHNLQLHSPFTVVVKRVLNYSTCWTSSLLIGCTKSLNHGAIESATGTLRTHLFCYLNDYNLDMLLVGSPTLNLSFDIIATRFICICFSAARQRTDRPLVPVNPSINPSINPSVNHQRIGLDKSDESNRALQASSGPYKPGIPAQSD